MRPQLTIRSSTRCRGCSLRHGRAFCNFGGPALQIFENLGYPLHFDAGESIFRAGDPYRGAFVVCTGELKLRGRRDGRPYEKLVRAGEVVALEPILSRLPYITSAAAVTQARVRFIPADALRRLMQENFDACMWALHFV